MRLKLAAAFMAFAAIMAGCSPATMPTKPADPPKIEAAPPQVEGPIRDRARERVLLAVVQSRAIKQMEKDGFALVGRNGTPLTRQEAESLYSRLTDEVVIGAIKEASPKAYGALGDGTLIANFVKWIADHQDEILAVLKFVMMILALL
jgi:hypothetical protein